MTVNDIVNFIKIKKLSADECESIMNALRSQPEVLTGDIVLKSTLDFLCDAGCDELGIIDKKGIEKVQKKARGLFADHLRYGTEGETDDLL